MVCDRAVCVYLAPLRSSQVLEKSDCASIERDALRILPSCTSFRLQSVKMETASDLQESAWVSLVEDPTLWFGGQGVMKRNVFLL